MNKIIQFLPILAGVSVLLGIMIGLFYALKLNDWGFLLGFGLASIVYHLAYRAKHGDWWA